jgi:hypothetical protein
MLAVVTWLATTQKGGEVVKAGWQLYISQAQPLAPHQPNLQWQRMTMLVCTQLVGPSLFRVVGCTGKCMDGPPER